MKQHWRLGILLLTCSATLLTGCESRAKREFNAGCQQSGVKRAICSCIYDRIEQHYSPETMQRMTDPELSQRMSPPSDFMNVVATATQQCAPSR
ncbi:hypothetical protein ACX1NX_08690 [Acinetobacter sp. ANC 5383]